MSQVESMLELLAIQPPSDPMHEGFWYVVVENTDEIRTRLTKLYPRSLSYEQRAETVLDSAVLLPYKAQLGRSQYSVVYLLCRACWRAVNQE